MHEIGFRSLTSIHLRKILPRLRHTPQDLHQLRQPVDLLSGRLLFGHTDLDARHQLVEPGRRRRLVDRSQRALVAIEESADPAQPLEVPLPVSRTASNARARGGKTAAGMRARCAGGLEIVTSSVAGRADRVAARPRPASAPTAASSTPTDPACFRTAGQAMRIDLALSCTADCTRWTRLTSVWTVASAIANSFSILC